MEEFEEAILNHENNGKWNIPPNIPNPKCPVSGVHSKATPAKFSK
jgi:hypothetical protein